MTAPWAIAKNGTPISPEFETWRQAARWAASHGHGSLGDSGGFMSKPRGLVWLTREKGIEVWDGHQLADYRELQDIL